jgi:hypothetical protein
MMTHAVRTPWRCVASNPSTWNCNLESGGAPNSFDSLLLIVGVFGGVNR